MNKLLLVVGLLLAAHISVAQYSEQPITQESSWTDRVFTGGGLGFGFGDVDWVNVSPVIGYRVTDRLAGGMSLTYRYSNYKRVTPALKTNDYGGSLFARYLVRAPIFLQMEYEYLNFEFPILAGETQRLDFNSFLGGGGIAQPVGRNAAFIITAMYNFSYANSAESPYASPWIIRGGITVGF
ncbi:MAG: hypothetical protein AAGC88_16715 [Bacteroidota bacterium]